MDAERKRVLTGDRPTGRMHLGHYVGSLAQRLRLQESHDCFIIVADLHSLTTRPGPDHISELSVNIHEMVLDYLAIGINPARSHIFLQSAVPETYELQLLLSMLVSVPRLERIPSLKDMAQAEGLEAMPLGLLGYPVLQAADILLPRAQLVPVGKDNEAHVEVAREVARRFNRLYGEVFPIPEALLGEYPSLIGLDGQAKMSKSRDNAIFLSDSPAVVSEKVRHMYTDPQRLRADIPGRVEGNPVFIYHEAFNTDRSEVEDLEARYRAGTVGDVEVKSRLIDALEAFLTPVRARREAFASQSGLVEEVLQAGTTRARLEARATMERVREAMGLFRLE
jgi:tryptophanyl-tRNA synthetase